MAAKRRRTSPGTGQSRYPASALRTAGPADVFGPDGEPLATAVLVLDRPAATDATATAATDATATAATDAAATATAAPGAPAPGAAAPGAPTRGGMGGIVDLPPLVDHGRPQPRATGRGRWWRRTRADLVAWARRHRVSALYLVPTLAVVGAVHAVGMSTFPAPVDDEGTYVAEAWAAAVHHTLTPYTYWYTHPPFGWIQIAGWGLLTDGFRPSIPAVVMGRQFMLVCFLLSVALVFVIARRLGIARGWATVAVLAFGLSPLAVHYDRMAYLDNVAVPWLLAAFALALSPGRRLWAYAGSGICFAGAVLSKETVLIFAPALVWQAWQAASRKTRAFCVTALLATFLLVGAAYPVYAALKGELLPGRGHVSLWSAVAFQLVNRPGSGSVFTATSRAHSLVSGWLQTDPWLLALGVGALPVAFVVRRLRPIAFAELIGVLVALKGGYLPGPYVVALLPLAGLVLAGASDALWARAWAPAGTRRRRDGALRWTGRLGLLATAAAVAALVVPAWAAGDQHAMTADQWGPVLRSETWVERHVPHGDRLLVSDTMWVDLVDHGFARKLGVVWFYKLTFVNNLDPSVTRRLPGGWRDFQYVIVTPSMRVALDGSPGQLRAVRQAIAHSVPVHRFGSGPGRVVVRRIGAHRPRRAAATALTRIGGDHNRHRSATRRRVADPRRPRRTATAGVADVRSPPATAVPPAVDPPPATGSSGTAHGGGQSQPRDGGSWTRPTAGAQSGEGDGSNRRSGHR